MERGYRSGFAVLCLLVLSGCSAFHLHPTKPDEMPKGDQEARLVGDVTVPFGMEPMQITAPGLVGSLPNTGSDPGPSPIRAAIVAEMQTRGVPNPNTVLQSKNVAAVMVTGYLRPGIQKGDHFDIQVRIPERSDTTSLRGGYLLETRLREMAVLGGQVREGTVLGLAQGPVLVDPMANAKTDKVALGRGRILGGGVCAKDRPMGLVIKPDYQNCSTSARIADAVNRRFHTVDKGVQKGVAKAKTDQFIELVLHPRYKDNVARYIKLVQSVALQESETERIERLAQLQHKLLDPTTAADAALQLEALGTKGVDVLLHGIASPDREVRFYSAEALAYLDRREAAEPLGEAARNVPAFRVFALTALSTMADYAAYEQLRDLLGGNSAETRYGAFRALWAMNAKDPTILGVSLGGPGGQFSYHVLDVAGQPMVHVTRSRRPEVVLFGRQQQLATPLVLNAGNNILVTSSGGSEVTVSKYAVGSSDQKRVVSTRVDDVIRAIADLGGTYPDVVQALQEAKKAGALESRLEVDALPEAGRTYERGVEVAGTPVPVPVDEAKPHSASPIPDLFQERGARLASHEEEIDEKPAKSATGTPEEAKKPASSPSLFDRMIGRQPQ